MQLFDELKQYCRFDATVDGEALRAFAVAARPHFQRISDDFYARLAEHEGAAKVFTGPAQIDRLKGTLRAWMELLLNGPWDQAYYEKRSRIGRVHVAIGLSQRYMFAAMNLVRMAMCDIAERQYRVEETVRTRTLRAINKILDIELAIMLESYAEERVERERQLERLQRERLAALGTMAAGLAHEIRNPLNAAHLQLTLAQRRLSRKQGADIDGALAATEIVASEMQRLAVLVDEVLQFARPQPLSPTRTEMRTAVEEVLKLLSEEIARAGVSIQLEPGEAIRLQLDLERFKQVLHNLVRNAVEATGKGGHVRVRVLPGPGTAVVEIEDDGRGLPSPDAPIFEPFFTTKPNGTGLGLAIVHRIVTDHGGHISVHSVPGRTVFRLEFPLSVVNHHHPQE